MEGKNQKQQAEIVKVLFVTRRERGPLRASPFRSGRDVSALPSDWIIAAGHDHCTSSFSKYQILSLPLAFTFFLTLHAHPPPPISPPLMSKHKRLSCHGYEYGLWGAVPYRDPPEGPTWRGAEAIPLRAGAIVLGVCPVLRREAERVSVGGSSSSYSS